MTSKAKEILEKAKKDLDNTIFPEGTPEYLKKIIFNLNKSELNDLLDSLERLEQFEEENQDLKFQLECKSKGNEIIIKQMDLFMKQRDKYQEALEGIINSKPRYSCRQELATLQELVDKENCNIEEVGSWGYFGGCRHITDDVKFAYLRGEIELTNEQKFWFLGQLINKSKNKLSTSHNLICNMRGMGGTDKSVLKKLLGVED